MSLLCTSKELCLTCKERPIYSKGECCRCYHYRRFTGSQRPLNCKRQNRQNFTSLEHPCQDCHIRPLYAKRLCHSCYNYFNRTGQHRPQPLREWKNTRQFYCVICFQLVPYPPSSPPRHCCSISCAAILRRVMHYKPKRCIKCQCLRQIRSRQMCGPCYVYSRYSLTKGYTVKFPRCPISRPYKQAVGIAYGSS